MTHHQLCSDDALPTPILEPPSKHVRGNPASALAVSTDPDAYRALDECEPLVQAVLVFLGAYTPGVATPPVTLKWLPLGSAYTTHGLMRKRAIYEQVPHAPEMVRAYTDSGYSEASALQILGKKRQFKGMAFSIELSRPVFEGSTLINRIQTVIHEACHVADALIAAKCPGAMARYIRQDGHGPSWRALMGRCEVPPDVYAKEDAIEMPIVTCPGCNQQHAVSPQTAVKVKQGYKIRCRKCYREIPWGAGGANVRVPASMTSAMEKAERRSRTKVYHCPCGQVFPITPSVLARMAPTTPPYRQPRCGGCHRYMSLEHVS